METFVIVIFASRLIGIAIHLGLLAKGDYPRKRDPAEPWHDVLGLVCSAVMAIWAWTLLGEHE